MPRQGKWSRLEKVTRVIRVVFYGQVLHAQLSTVYLTSVGSFVLQIRAVRIAILNR